MLFYIPDELPTSHRPHTSTIVNYMVLIKVKKRGIMCASCVCWRVVFLFLCMIESVCTQITRQREHERIFSCYQKIRRREVSEKRRNTIRQWLHGNILQDKMKERENAVCGGTRALI